MRTETTLQARLHLPHTASTRPDPKSHPTQRKLSPFSVKMLVMHRWFRAAPSCSQRYVLEPLRFRVFQGIRMKAKRRCLPTFGTAAISCIVLVAYRAGTCLRARDLAGIVELRSESQHLQLERKRLGAHSHNPHAPPAVGPELAKKEHRFRGICRVFEHLGDRFGLRASAVLCHVGQEETLAWPSSLNLRLDLKRCLVLSQAARLGGFAFFSIAQ